MFDSWTSVLPDADAVLVANVSFLANAAVDAAPLVRATIGLQGVEILAGLFARRVPRA